LQQKNSAEHLGIADRKGLVKENLEADLILLDANPAENISNISIINTVFLKGSIVYSQNIIQSYDIPGYSFSENLVSAEYVNTAGTESRKLNFERYRDEKIVTQTTFKNGEKFSEEEFTVEENLSAVKWHYVRTSDNTEITACKENGNINMSGTFKGKAQNKSFKISNGLWYQMMDMNMPAFINSGLEEILFYSIGTGDNRGAMSLGEFAAKNLGTEDITIEGTKYSCVKVSFVLTMFSWAWTGLYWYDRKTGQLVQNGTKKGDDETILWKLKKFEFK